MVINADDYYGKEGFRAVHKYIVSGGAACMAGFALKNTLSDNGGVTHGICAMDADGNLTKVVETRNIVKTGAGVEADGVVLDANSLVSMNMWWSDSCISQSSGRGFCRVFPERSFCESPQGRVPDSYIHRIAACTGKNVSQGSQNQ